MTARWPGLRDAAEATLREATGATAVVRLCPHCGSAAHGCPRLIGSDWAVSIGYAGPVAVVAWGPGPLGIDAEEITADPRVSELLAWTRVEALAKAAGTGLGAWPDPVLPDLPTRSLDLPNGYVGTLAGHAAGWALARI